MARPARALTLAARTLLVITAAVAVLYVVLPMLIGSEGLDLSNHALHSPTREYVMNIEVTGTDRLIHERLPDGLPAAFQWKDSSNGTVDAATGKPAVELFMFDGMRLNFWGPTWLDRWAYAGPSLLVALLTLAVLFLLYRIVGTVARNDVFCAANARRLIWIGLLVGVGGSVTQLVAYAAHTSMVDRSAAAGLVRVPFHFGAGPLLAGLLVLVLAEAFRQGVRLRADVDGLI
jgi:hypothetical protein